MKPMRTTFSNWRAVWTARSFFLALLVVLVGASVIPSDAQTNEEIESIRKERKEVQAEKAEQAKKVDAASAELDVLLDALQIMQAEVNDQEARLGEAKAQLAARERESSAAIEAVELKIIEIGDLEDQLASRAVSSFVASGEGETSPLLEASDPTQAARMQELVNGATKTDIEIAESLSAAQEDLEVNRAIARDAQAQAEELKVQIAAQLVELEEVRDVQAALSAEAEIRLDDLLNRLAEIEAQDQNLKSKEDKAVAAEAARIAAELAKKRQGSRGGGGRIPIPAPSEIVTVRGFRVHESISGNVDRMIGDAAAAGITLGGWGWRDNSTQIRLRKAHCGTSNYAIYEMSASRCRPPTARPGSSMHERGMAIDFTYNGRTIGSRSSKAYKWLKAHAASYGFYNLPSEPWHWSTNGR